MNFGRASQRSDGLESWTCFPEVRWFGISDVLPKGPMVWNLDVLHRGPKIEFWTCFPEVQGLKFGRAAQRSDGLEFGRASQRSIEIEFGHASQRFDGLKFGRTS